MKKKEREMPQLLTPERARELVTRGYKYLDIKYPKWRKRARPTKFSLWSDTACPLVQASGKRTFEDALSPHSMRWAREHGFVPPNTLPVLRHAGYVDNAGTAADRDLLSQTWRDLFTRTP
jgi:hypothetical protein